LGEVPRSSNTTSEADDAYRWARRRHRRSLL